MEGSNYQDDFNEEGMTFRVEADTDPLEIDWAIRFKTAAVLNVDGQRWRTVLPSTIEVPSVDITYGITAMKELLRQLEGALSSRRCSRYAYASSCAGILDTRSGANRW
uniref:Uncharacterized protein n=1 Tax=Phytophthora ramorum TaxID=164328 RepID=H3HBR8_PHYRM